MRKSSGKCVNPKIGTHPDLFERGPSGEALETDVWVDPPEGEGTHVEGLTDAQLKALPRDAFSQTDWDALDYDIAEYILDNDPDSQARVDHMVDEFTERYKWAAEPTDTTGGPGTDYMLESEGESFHSWLAERADSLIDDVERRVRSGRENIEETVERHKDRFTEETIRAAINEALQDTNNYDEEISGNETGSFYVSSVGEQTVNFDRSELAEIIQHMYPEEIDRALERINHDTDMHIKPKALNGPYGLEVYVDCGLYYHADINWPKVDTAVDDILNEKEEEVGVVEEIATPPEQRVVYRFADGFYVQDLLSTELKDESKAMGICVGDDRYGYTSAVKRGETKIFSLRRPSGKPLFTIEAKMGPFNSHFVAGELVDEPPKVTSIVQIKGKANRLPGWDVGNAGHGGYAAMKADEVAKAIEFVSTLGGQLGIDPFSVDDLSPALHAIHDVPDQKMLDKRLVLFAKKNPGRRRRRNANDRPKGFDSPWTP
jgi:hypothetical protein